MRAYYFLLALFSCCLHGLAQEDTKALDSLRTQLNSATHDSTRSLLLAQLSLKYFNLPDSHLTLATKGLALATASAFDKGIAYNLYCLAVYHTDHLTSLNYLNRALAIEKKYGNKLQLARIYMLMGAIHGEKNDPRNAIQYAKMSYQLFQEADNENGIVRSLNNVGYEYIKLHRFDSAEYFLKKALQRNRSGSNSYAVKASLAELYLVKNNFSKATSYLLEAIQENNGKDLYVQADNYSNLAAIYEMQGRYEQAISSAERALTMAQQAGSLSAQNRALQKLSSLWQKFSNYEKALNYLQQSIQVKDSIFSLEQKDQEAKLFAQINEHDKEARIKMLRKENELREARLQLQQEDIWKKNLILISFVVLIILLAFFTLILRAQNIAKKKYINTIENKNKTIELQANELKEMVHQLSDLNITLEEKAMERAVKIVEQERKLTEYAFINSHKLRGPVATISGIMYLLKSGLLDREEKAQMTESIFREIQKIDSVISEINKAIE